MAAYIPFCLMPLNRNSGVRQTGAKSCVLSLGNASKSALNITSVYLEAVAGSNEEMLDWILYYSMRYDYNALNNEVTFLRGYEKAFNGLNQKLSLLNMKDFFLL